MKKEIKEEMIKILREFDLANTDLEPERTTVIQKAEASIETENEYADQILELFEQEKQKWVGEILPKRKRITTWSGCKDEDSPRYKMGWNACLEQLKQRIKNK